MTRKPKNLSDRSPLARPVAKSEHPPIHAAGPVMHGRGPMSEEDIRARLVGLVRDNDLFPVDLDPETLEQDLFERGVADSMTAVYLVELIGEEFGVDLDLHMLSVEFNSLNAIARYIWRARH